MLAPNAILQTESQPLLIDLRSPAEFAQDHLPGAVSIPLFGDVERSVIGTLYKRESPQVAFDKGRDLAGARIRALLSEIGRTTNWNVEGDDFEADLLRWTANGMEALEGELQSHQLDSPPHKGVVFYCWRGGLRSRSVVAFVRSLGFESACCMEGGYKAYRRFVNAELAQLDFPPAFVLRGLTGVGKTLVLRELEQLRPEWIVDLEGLAGHRSSILGMVGLEPCSQKAFDSRLADLLRNRDYTHAQAAVVYEGESRKVGNVTVPPALWDSLCSGQNFRITASIERRVDVLLEDYLERESSRKELEQQLPFIERRLGAVKWKGELVGLLNDGRERELVKLLLEHYYDPLYRHSEKGQSYRWTIDASQPARAAKEIESCILSNVER